MKHLRGFIINEKVSMKELLFYGALYFGSSHLWNDYKDYRILNNIYTQINSKSSLPDSSEQKVVDSARQAIISDIKTSKRWERFDRRLLLDSISKVEFRFLDSVEFSKMDHESIAVFINIESLKGQTRIDIKPLLNPPGNNIIAINSAYIHDDNFNNIIVHELYHYVDKVTGYMLMDDRLLDKRVFTDEKYAANKYFMLVRMEYMDKDISSLKIIGLDNKQVDILKLDKEYLDMIMNKKDYLTSRPELFARINSLKEDMIGKGILKSMDDKVTIKKCQLYLKGASISKAITAHDILMVLDWKKLDQI